MSAKNAITALTDLLKSVASTGPNVYDQVRYAREADDYGALFLDKTDANNPFVHTWMVTREGSRGVDTPFMQSAGAMHQVVATGFRAFQDGASEPLWQAELDAIFYTLVPFVGRRGLAILTDDAGNIVRDDAGNAVTSLDGAIENFDWSGPPQIEGVKMAWFGTVLCHTARLIMPFQEFPL